MSQAESILRKMLDLANRQDADTMQQYLTDDLQFDNPVTGPTDKNGMHQFHQGFFGAFPDIHYTIDKLVDDGQVLAIESTVTGTQRGQLMAIPPTNKKMELKAAFFVEARGDKISKWRSYFDSASMLRQLGVLPEPAAAGART